MRPKTTRYLESLYEEFKNNFWDKGKLDSMSNMGEEVLRKFMYGIYISENFQDDDPTYFMGSSSLSNLPSFITELESLGGERILDLFEGLLIRPNLYGVTKLKEFYANQFFEECKNLLIELDNYTKNLDENEFQIIREIIKKKPSHPENDFFIRYKKYLKHIKDNPNTNADAIYILENFYHPDYELLKVLGSGANKTVFLAQSKFVHDSRFALKLLDLEKIRINLRERNGIYLTDEELIEHEIRAAELSMLDEQVYLSRVRTVFYQRYQNYIIIENLFDMTLKEIINEKGKISTPLGVIKLGEQILNGLSIFHRHGLCHGDLNAANVGLKISKSNDYSISWPFQFYNLNSHELSDKLFLRVALTDAGFATTFKMDDRSGTWYFGGVSIRAPELYYFTNKWERPRLVRPTAASDLWSLGVLMYYAATGEYPFYNSSDRGDLKEYERKVYGDIKFKLDKPEERLFNRKEFQDDNPTDLEREIHREYYGDLEAQKKIISNLLRIKPEERKFSWE